jgi:hypothetical protein
MYGGLSPQDLKRKFQFVVIIANVLNQQVSLDSQVLTEIDRITSMRSSKYFNRLANLFNLNINK